MNATNILFILLITTCFLIHIINAVKKPKQKATREYINCSNFTYVKKPFDIVLDDDINTEDDPDPLDTIINRIITNSEKIRYSLCQIKSSFEKDIHLAEIEADTFNNDRLEQLDGTVTSRRVGSALRHTVLKVGECVSNVAKQVLVLPIRIKPEIPCVTRELLSLKNYSTDIANVITGALKSIVHYPRHMAICFKTEEKINCLSKLHKKVIRNTIADIMGVVERSVDIDKTFQLIPASGKIAKCPEYSQTVSKLAAIPLKLTQCINNKIY